MGPVLYPILPYKSSSPAIGVPKNTSANPLNLCKVASGVVKRPSESSSAPNENQMKKGLYLNDGTPRTTHGQRKTSPQFNATPLAQVDFRIVC